MVSRPNAAAPRAGDEGAGALGRAGDARAAGSSRAPRATSARGCPTATSVLTPSSLDYLDDDARRPRGVRPRRQRASRASAGPTTEKALHLVGAAAHHEIDATIHCHAKYATMFALTREPIPAVIEEFVVYVGGDVEVATTRPPAPTSSPRRSPSASATAPRCSWPTTGCSPSARRPRTCCTSPRLVERTAEIVWGAQRARRRSCRSPTRSARPVRRATTASGAPGSSESRRPITHGRACGAG